MVTRSEPNAQNSEINPQAHPSGARIERLIKRASDEAAQASERGAAGETLRPSEREDRILTDDQIRDLPAEGESEAKNARPNAREEAHGVHRRAPETREH